MEIQTAEAYVRDFASQDTRYLRDFDVYPEQGAPAAIAQWRTRCAAEGADADGTEALDLLGDTRAAEVYAEERAEIEGTK